MKLLVVTSLKDYQKEVVKIFSDAEIEVFSITETIGIKDHSEINLLDNWFSSGADHFDSIFIFSFTDEVKAGKALELIKQYNITQKTGFPVRAFVMPVETSSYT